MSGEAGQPLLLPPMATPSAGEHSEHFSPQAQAANLVHYGLHLTLNHSTAHRSPGNMLPNGKEHSQLGESANKKQRVLTGAARGSMAMNTHSHPVGSVASNSVVKSGLGGVFHTAAIQGLANLQATAVPQHQRLALQNFPGPHIALGLQQANPLLQVPLASLQVMNTVNVNANVQGVGTVLPGLPLFHAHPSQPKPASGVSKAGYMASDGNMGMNQGLGDISLVSSQVASKALRLSHIASENGSSNNSSTTTTNQNSNSGSNSDDDAREQDGRSSRRLARREYHKKIERKRRDRMRSLYDELRALTDAAELADKNGVLESAIALIQQQREQIDQLKASTGGVNAQDLSALSAATHIAISSHGSAALKSPTGESSSSTSNSGTGACPSESSARGGMMSAQEEDHSCASSSSSSSHDVNSLSAQVRAKSENGGSEIGASGGSGCAKRANNAVTTCSLTPCSRHL